MNWKLMMLLKRLHNAAGSDGSDAGGADTAGAEQPPPAQLEDRGDVVDPELTQENLAALAGEAGEAGAVEAAGTATPGEADEEGQGGGQGIPKGRFNEVNQKRKDAEAALEAAQKEIERLRAAAAPAAPAAPAAAPGPAIATPAAAPAAGVFDEEAQEEAYVAALMEGDARKAAQIRRGINAHLRTEAANTALQRADEQRHAEQQRVIAQALQAESVLAVEKYPYLDTAEGAEALELIVAARDAKVARGMPAHEALRAAVATIAPRFAPVGGDESGAPPSRVSKAAPEAADSRTSAAIARGAAASIAQPPALNGGVGDRANAGKVNVAQMTDEQFENLSPAEIKKLRGD